jgi:hypothetical protein
MPSQGRTKLGFGAVALLTAALAASACHTSGEQASSAPVVGVSGRVGPLRVDVSDRRAVVAFAGPPTAERRGRSPAAPFRSAPYDALGYGCSRRAGPDTFPLVRAGGPACRTVFFLDARSGRLGTFYTVDPRYRLSRGVRVGMPTREAERLLRLRVHVACVAAIYLTSGRATLTVLFSGGALHRDGTMSGGHVDALVLHALRHDPGVFECM